MAEGNFKGTASTETYAAPHRFEVDPEGMRSLNGSREPWDLVKELVQNAWDEAPEATLCTITAKPHPEGGVLIVAEDDGGGFKNPADAYTLMGDTVKRSDPRKRGRFNLGEKETVSVALSATVETVGTTIEFPAIGGRAIWTNERERGTKITLHMPWEKDAIEPLRKRLSLFRPTDCALTVNGEKVPEREPLKVREVSLPTILQSGPGEPVRRTVRKTEIHVLEIAPERVGEDADGNRTGGMIYEMGIPIQPIQAGYDVDVQQKVPMPPNRTTVSEKYLSDIYAETLNAMSETMVDSEFSETWARSAVENERRAERGAVKQYFNSKYGEGSLLTSSSAESNMLAAEKGITVVNPRSMSEAERRQAKVAGMQTTHQALGRKVIIPAFVPPEERTGDMELFSAWVKEIAEAVGIIGIRVDYVDNPEAKIAACCTGQARVNPILTFNVGILQREFFAGRGPAQVEIVIHELAHAWQSKAMEHGPSWGNAACEVGAKVALYLTGVARVRASALATSQLP